MMADKGLRYMVKCARPRTETSGTHDCTRAKAEQ